MTAVRSEGPEIARAIARPPYVHSGAQFRHGVYSSPDQVFLEIQGTEETVIRSVLQMQPGETYLVSGPQHNWSRILHCIAEGKYTVKRELAVLYHPAAHAATLVLQPPARGDCCMRFAPGSIGCRNLPPGADLM